MKLYWDGIELNKQNLASFSISELYKMKQSLAPLAYKYEDIHLKALLLVNNEISRKLIKEKKQHV